MSEEELPPVSDEALQRLIDHCVKSRFKSPWFQDVESALRELQKLRNALELIADGNADDECASPLTKEDMMKTANSALGAPTSSKPE